MRFLHFMLARPKVFLDQVKMTVEAENVMDIPGLERGKADGIGIGEIPVTEAVQEGFCASRKGLVGIYEDEPLTRYSLLNHVQEQAAGGVAHVVAQPGIRFGNGQQGGKEPGVLGKRGAKGRGLVVSFFLIIRGR